MTAAAQLRQRVDLQETPRVIEKARPLFSATHGRDSRWNEALKRIGKLKMSPTWTISVSALL